MSHRFSSHFHPPSSSSFFPPSGSLRRSRCSRRRSWSEKSHDRGEAKLTPDAMPETRIQPERKKQRARANARLVEGKGRRVRLLRDAHHYCSRKKFQGSGERMRWNEKLDSRIRASTEERRCPRITKCLVERNFGKLKRYEATMDVGERCC